MFNTRPEAQPMPTSFKPMRRKIGVLTLVMACVFMAGWVRSKSKFENLEIPLGETAYAYGVTSKGGGIDVYRVAGMEPAGEWIYSSRPAPLDENGHPKLATPWESHHEIEWRWDWAGFHVGVSRWNRMNWQIESCMIPYWSIVIPLTLISAWLLLSRPRVAKSNLISEK